MFSFDAKITGNAFAGSTLEREHNGDGTSNPPAPVTYSILQRNQNRTL
jgi:hypothetical protein